MISMISRPSTNPNSLDEDDFSSASPFDRVSEEADLWFLPEREPVDTALPPLPRADRRKLFDVAEWRRAQAGLSGELADLACRFGALDERLRDAGEGARQRLALREVAELSWWSGGRIGGERLGLWLGARLGGAGEDGPALAEAGWVLRRLMAGQGPAKGGWTSGIAGFLGRAALADADDLAEVMEPAAALHPVVQAALLFQVWRILGQGPARGMEAAAMAACHGATMGQGHAGFLPLTGAGALALRATGTAEARLAAWLTGAEQATRVALGQLERVARWRAATAERLQDLSGRTPGLLLDLLAAWPMVTAPMAEAQTGASRAAVQRNLDLLVTRQVIREISGQGRYRVWMARLPG